MSAKPAEDKNSQFMEDILRTTWAISLGAAQKGLEMVSKPEESLTAIMSHAQTLITVPEGTANRLPDQAQALAGVWLEKGTTFVMECKAAGEQKR